MRRAATAIGALAIVATLATACGSSGSDDAKSEATTTTEAEAKGTTTTTADSNAPTEAQLESALLTAAEMGDGWTAESADSDSGPKCLAPLFEDGTIPGPQAQIEFSYTAENGVEAAVWEGLAYAGEDSESVFDEVKSTLDSCTNVESTSDSPDTIEPLAPPSVGTESAAWVATFSDGTETIEVQIAAALQSNVVVLTMGAYSTGAVTFEQSAMEPIIQGAVTKVEQAANA